MRHAKVIACRNALEDVTDDASQYVADALVEELTTSEYIMLMEIMDDD